MSDATLQKLYLSLSYMKIQYKIRFFSSKPSMLYHKCIQLLKILGLCSQCGDYTIHKTDNGFGKLLNEIYNVCLLVSKALLVHEMHIGKNKEDEIDSKVSTFQPFQKR